MTLYHFTARRFVDAILREGITRGFVLINFSGLRFTAEYRWLTTNPSFVQAWADGTGRLPYNRNEVRLTVEVPPEHERLVHKWSALGPILSDEYRALSMLGDPENWRLFKGSVPPMWITATDENPPLSSVPAAPRAAERAARTPGTGGGA